MANVPNIFVENNRYVVAWEKVMYAIQDSNTGTVFMIWDTCIYLQYYRYHHLGVTVWWWTLWCRKL